MKFKGNAIYATVLVFLWYFVAWLLVPMQPWWYGVLWWALMIVVFLADDVRRNR